MACYGYEGIDAVKEALRAGLNCSTETMPIKVSSLFSPSLLKYPLNPKLNPDFFNDHISYQVLLKVAFDDTSRDCLKLHVGFCCSSCYCHYG